MDEEERVRRWALVVPHRERLMSLARRLVRDPGDAEACVHEAMVRCVTFPTLDEANVAGFLVTTTRRICIDHHRLQARDGRVAARLSGMTSAEPHIDEAVCDRAEAAWVSARLADLPERQRAALHARRDGRSHAEIAEYLSVSYKTVETLLYRARTRARAELERTWALLPAFVRRPRTGWGAAGAGSVAIVTTTAMLLAPLHLGPAPVTGPSVPPLEIGLGEAAPLPKPALGPTWSPRPHLARRPAGSTPLPARSQDSERSTSADCPYPPYTADPCVRPPDPTGTGRPPGTGLLDCVFYGIDQTSGFICNSSPTPAPTHSPSDEPEGADR